MSDWPAVEPIDPDRGRALARWLRWAAAKTGDASKEHLADAVLAEAEAVEAGDEEAWIAAVAAQVRAER